MVTAEQTGRAGQEVPAKVWASEFEERIQRQKRRERNAKNRCGRPRMP